MKLKLENLFIALLLFGNLTVTAQEDLVENVYRFDTGKGNRLKLEFAIAIINLIEQNNPEEVQKYFTEDYKYNEADLKKNCKMISDFSPYQEFLYPASIVKESKNELWYERSYYKMVANKRKYYFQIHVELSKDDEQKITSLKFRKDKDIVNREQEFKDDRKPGMPPPPPAIPGKLK
ncbi:hypothetical protein [Maribellus mangrovi]|uniref:hypothetical protein n=1 Tax=Maribellus mangrovi TaxID=3133146 RepID=UPI0030ED3F63